jgi:hypothetical protein
MGYDIDTTNFRFDDARLADRMEARIKELREQLRYTDTERGRFHAQDEIDHYESVLRQMCC